MEKILRVVGLCFLVLGLYKLYRKWSTKVMLNRLRGKVVLVTGASSGLGEGKCIMCS